MPNQQPTNQREANRNRNRTQGGRRPHHLKVSCSQSTWASLAIPIPIDYAIFDCGSEIDFDFDFDCDCDFEIDFDYNVIIDIPY
jgi:hypothetical protein